MVEAGAQIVPSNGRKQKHDSSWRRSYNRERKMNKTENGMDIELDLMEVLLILIKKIWIILACTVAVGLGAFLISRFLITPQYTASISMYVYNGEKRTDQLITASDLSTSQKLVQTYIVVLTSNTVLERVSSQLDHAYTTDELRDMIEASSISDTEAFGVTVTNPDPAAAQKIANTIAEFAPDEIIRVVKAGGVEVIDYAVLPDKPSSPHSMRNGAIGALLGLVLSSLLVVVLALLDTTIRSEEDLTNKFDLPVLGVIPSLTANKGDGGYSRYGRYAN